MQTNNPSQKRRFDHPPQQPQYPVRFGQPPQQGPQNTLPQRNTVPAGGLRGQNVQGRQSQPQQQIQQQNVTQNAVATAVQQHQQHAVAVQPGLSYQYTPQGPVMVHQAYPQQPNTGQLYSFAYRPQQYYIQQNIPSYYPAHMPTSHQTQPHHQYYTSTPVAAAAPQYMPAHARVPTQIQQSHVTQQHVVSQHQAHHQAQHHVPAAAATHHPGQHQPHANQHPPISITQVSTSIPPTQGGRSEGGPPPAERKKKLLNIIDPNTGQNVLDTRVPTEASSSAASSADSGKPVNSTPLDSTTVAPLSGAVSSNVALEKAIDTSVHHPGFPSSDAKPIEEVSVTGTSKVDDTSPEEGVPEAGEQANKSTSAIRAEFFQKITQASDEGRVNSNSSNQNASQQQPPPSTSAPDTTNAQPETSKLNSTNPIGDRASTPEEKDASLASISPTPMDDYITPTPKSSRISSPPPPVKPLELPEEDVTENTSTVEEEEEPTVEADVVEQTPVTPPGQGEASVTTSEHALSPVSDTTETPLDVPEEENKDVVAIENAEPEVVQEIVAAESPSPVSAEAEEQQNGSLKLEEGEIGPDEEQSPSNEESGGEEVDSENESKNKKGGIIRYEREFLLSLEKQPLSRVKVAIEIPDVAKDNTNHAKGHHGQMQNKSPANNYNNNMRGQGRMKTGGGGLNSGNINLLSGMRVGMQTHAGMQWSPMMIPPAPPGLRNPPKIITLTSEEVKLHKAEDAWKPSSVRQSRAPAKEEEKSEEQITDDIVKRTRGILNKITPENFDTLLGKFIQLPLNDMEERISSVIKVVFEKAIDEPSFATTYAKMVYTVCKTSPETSKKFRKQILDQCQKEFQKNTTDEDELKLTEEKIAAAAEGEEKELLKLDLEDKKTGMRRRSLGNVRFIGELYKLQMLTPKIMVECVNMLLHTTNPDEENLECLCKLLTTVGQKLDENLRDQESKVQHCKANKMEPPKFVPEDKYMDKTFNKLRTLSDNKVLSSRIRFALLDAVELRENGWKPRRDSNAPKTIEEVRRDAIRQEIEEKRQINSLPPASGPGMDQRGGPPGRQQSNMGSQQKKTGDWNTVQSNKSSRFQVKKPDQAGMPVLAPSGGTWGRGPGPVMGSTQNNSLPSPSASKPFTPPRFNRFQTLSSDEQPRNNNMPMNNQSPSNFRDQVPPQQIHSQFPPIRRPSPATSTASSRENSRPVSPKEPSPAGGVDNCSADVNETVKNIFEEYLSVKKYDDTLHWINKRFPGTRISEFVEELSRQVVEMSKEEQHKVAGHLVRLLCKNKVVGKDVLLNAIVQGVVQDLPDICIDVPKATTYLGQYLLEIFVDEGDLDWLVTLVEPLMNDDYNESTGKELISNTLNLLKLRRNEEAVQVLYKKTTKKDALQSVTWLGGETVETLSQKIIPVLRHGLQSPSVQLTQLFQEKSWDLREERTVESLTEAICTIAWTEKKNWDVEMLNRLLPTLPLPNPTLFPKIWTQAKSNFQRNDIDKHHEDELWTLLSKLRLNE